MADEHIDYGECGEYAAHFCAEAKGLIGATPLVDVEALIALVKATAHAVATELAKQTSMTSAARDDRGKVEASTEAGRQEVTRFYTYLGSLDADVQHDKRAFFPGGKRGDVSKLKPADMQKKLAQVLSGFAAKSNEELPDASKWQPRIQKAHDDLAKAIELKTGSVGTKIVHTKELVAARKAFLSAYTSVAKPLVRGILAQLGRDEKEIRLYFKDLTVQDTKPRKSPPALGAAED